MSTKSIVSVPAITEGISQGDLFRNVNITILMRKKMIASM